MDMNKKDYRKYRRQKEAQLEQYYYAQIRKDGFLATLHSAEIRRDMLGDEVTPDADETIEFIWTAEFVGQYPGLLN